MCIVIMGRIVYCRCLYWATK